MSKKNVKKNENKAKKVLATVSIILVAVIVLGVVGVYSIFSSGSIERNTVAAKTEHFTVTTAMMNYLYQTSYQNLVSNSGSYLELMGLDTEKPLDEQKYTTDKTWHDYMVDTTRSQLTEALVLCEAAVANGVELDDADKADIQETLDTFEGFAKTNSVSLEYYVKAIFGSSVNPGVIRSSLEILKLAEKYQEILTDSYKYEKADWDKYYNENTDDFLKIDYLTFTFEAEVEDDKKNDKETDVVTDEHGHSADAHTHAKGGASDVAEAAETTGADDKAKEPAIEATYAAELAATKTAEEFNAYVENYLRNVKYAGLTEEELEEDEVDIDELVEECLKEAQTIGSTGDFNKWAAEEGRVAYDTYFDPEAEEGEYTVYMLLPAPEGSDLGFACKYRESYILKNFRYIPVQHDHDEKDDAKAMAAAKEDAEDILKEYTANPTEDNFAKMAEPDMYGDGTYEGGLVEGADKGVINEEVGEWLYSAERVAGDTTIIEVDEFGYYILYYVGDYDMVKWEANANVALKNAKYSEDYEAFKADYEVTYYKKGVNLIAVG